MRRSFLFLFLAILAASCRRTPPAEQRPSRPFISMNDPAVKAYIVRDIDGTLQAGTWRWAGQNPTLRFRLPVTDNLNFVMDFAIAGVTLQQTGPVTITFTVNGRELSKATYDAEGNKHFSKPVPSEWLSTDSDTIVSAALDKVYVSPSDHARLGLILTRAGFTR